MQIGDFVMTIYDIFFLLGGLGLFLYGMSLMSDGLSLIAGSQLKKILKRLTRNKWLGAFLGFIITAVIQSSTATTVMVLGFIDSSLMNLSQAAGIIMGANAGTILTGILFTFNIQDIVPFVIFVGTIATLFMKRKAFNHMGMILLGFGLLFLGLNLMKCFNDPFKRSTSHGGTVYAYANASRGFIGGLCCYCFDSKFNCISRDFADDGCCGYCS